MAFAAFDKEKKGSIGTDVVGTILSMLGHEIPPEELAAIIGEVDMWGKYIILLMIQYIRKLIKRKIAFFITIFSCVSISNNNIL